MGITQDCYFKMLFICERSFYPDRKIIYLLGQSLCKGKFPLADGL